MALEPEITVRNVTRNDSGNAWEVDFSIRFRQIGYFTSSVSVPLSDDAKAYPRIERTVGEASDMAHNIIVTDLLRTVLYHSKWLNEQTRETITKAFPQKQMAQS
ncbi:hypothetical protein GCM10011491_30510 [Brucella endophytica]|uniref:Uncharacterized protein n=1 Tax=Brucella endophytica TaxID=1963359 RepID=A0A916SH12_9HYPH|nr:hypothetical protein GCM10011491_30510 [Brucella endophytica]